ncbi:MAG: Mandelate racemase/muconate lactonizing protein [Caulobacter sp.]|nr:Mandelate racemase/muconate lactonizing protein [Caulobacter sp.]
MRRQLIATPLSWPLASPFRISRGVKTSADVVHVELSQGDVVGRGEAVPYGRYNETQSLVLEQIRAVQDRIEAGLTRTALLEALPPGAARNAVDAALWDLESRLCGQPVWARIGEASPPPALACALTISLDTPQVMGEAAAKIADAALIKIKVDASDPEAQIAAVRAAAPRARLIVDPNEGWSFDMLRRLQPALVAARVDLVEQPLPADEDAVLEGFSPLVPLCADESCHTAKDLPTLRGRYQVVNIKLDKSGGLTAALTLLDAAREAGFGIMAGCMVCGSLGIAPAFHIGRHAAFVDLDGPLWLRDDAPGGVAVADGRLRPPAPGFWGDGAETTV